GTYFALPHKVAHRAHGFGERRRVVLFVQVIDVDSVGAETPQAGFGRLHNPSPRQPSVVRAGAHRIGALGGEDPVAALGADETADDLLGQALVVNVRRVDEVDA